MIFGKKIELKVYVNQILYQIYKLLRFTLMISLVFFISNIL
jgi:hypothetical protein